MSRRPLLVLTLLPLAACFSNLDVDPDLPDDTGGEPAQGGDEGGDEDDGGDEGGDDGDGDDTAGPGDDTGDGEEPPPAEDCGSGADDDLDGFADCTDSADCADDDACTCVDDTAGNWTGTMLTGDTTADDDTYSRGDGTCGSTASSGPDHVVAWTAPDDACYVVHTFGTEFDTVLRRLDGCDGEEIACSDDARDRSGSHTSQSMLRVGGVAGQAYTFVVDGWSEATAGAWTLTAERTDAQVDLSAGDSLGGAMGASVASGSNTNSTLAVDAGCTSGTEAASVQYQWTAPRTGTVTVDSIGSDYDTVLAVYGTSGCVELDCNDDAPDDGSGSYERASQVTFEAVEGTTYVIVLSGYSGADGNFVLNIR
jgi:hypothetical protein